MKKEKSYLVYLKIPAGVTIWSGPGSAKTHYNTTNEELAKNRKESLFNFLAGRVGKEPEWVRSEGAFRTVLKDEDVKEIADLPIVRKVLPEPKEK